MSSSTREPALSLTGRLIAGATLAVCAMLLFARLGHYPLWDDEANTALFAESLWESGDLSARLGDNVVAFRDGLELNADLENRYIPPLQYLVAAPFAGSAPGDPLYARLPFAALMLAALSLFFYWITRYRPSELLLGICSLGVVGNIALLLYGRQSRYYALAVLFTVAACFLYQRGRSWRGVVALNVAGALLLASNYLNYACVGLALAVDYALWGRKSRPYSRAQLVVSAVVQLALVLVFLTIFNPFGRDLGQGAPENDLLDRVWLFATNLRDANAGELVAGLALVGAPILLILERRRYQSGEYTLLLRLWTGVMVVIAATSLLSPQPLALAEVADIRYLVPLAPALIVLTAVLIHSLPLPGSFRLGIAVLVFQTTLFHAGLARLVGGPDVPLRSTLMSHVGELISPQTSPYRPAARWLRDNVEPGATVVAVPDFTTYPLMHGARHVVYGWQFEPTSRDRYPGLAPIHFRGVEFPSYLVVFGPAVVEYRQVMAMFRERYGISYTERAVIDVYGVDMTRPEMFWRSFERRDDFDRDSEAVYVFERR